MFYNFDEDRCEQPGEYLGDREIAECEAEDVNGDELAARAVGPQEGGLAEWEYECPFLGFDVTIDEVDSILEERFIQEGKSILESLLSELSRESDAHCYENETNETDQLGENQRAAGSQHSRFSLTQFSALQIFVA